MIASIRRTADGRSYRVEFPFDRAVVEAIKRIVPAHPRTYDPGEKAWYIAPAYRDIIRELLADVFIEVEPDAERAASPPPPSGSVTVPAEYRALHLLPSAPVELVEAAYKCLSRLHHPDRGGDTEKMQAINAAAIEPTVIVSFLATYGSMAGLAGVLLVATNNVADYFADNPMSAVDLAVAVQANWDGIVEMAFSILAIELAIMDALGIVPGAALLIQVPNKIKALWSGEVDTDDLPSASELIEWVLNKIVPGSGTLIVNVPARIDIDWTGEGDTSSPDFDWMSGATEEIEIDMIAAANVTVVDAITGRDLTWAEVEKKVQQSMAGQDTGITLEDGKLIVDPTRWEIEGLEDLAEGVVAPGTFSADLAQTLQADLNASPIDLDVPIGAVTFTGGGAAGGAGGGRARGFGGGGGIFDSLVTQAQTALQTITVAVTTQSAAWGAVLGAQGTAIGAALSLAFTGALTAAQTSLQTITVAVTTHSSAGAVIVGAQGAAMAAAASGATAAMLGAIQAGFQSATTAVTTHAQAWAVIVAAQGAAMAASAAAAAESVRASLATGMQEATTAVTTHSGSWAAIINAAAGPMGAAGYNAGAAAGFGVANGIASAEGAVSAAAARLISIVESTMARVGEMRSPSRLTARLGAYLGDGLAIGMLSTIPTISSAAGAMTQAATPYLPATGAAGGLAAQTNINAPVSVNATINGGDGWSDADKKQFAREFAVAIRDGVEIEYTSQGA